jgi:hypothetical protein
VYVELDALAKVMHCAVVDVLGCSNYNTIEIVKSPQAEILLNKIIQQEHVVC